MPEGESEFVPPEAEAFRQSKEIPRATNPEAKVLIEEKPFPEEAQMIFKDDIYSLKEVLPDLKDQEKIIILKMDKVLDDILKKSKKGLEGAFRERQGFLIGRYYRDPESGLHYEVVSAVEHLPLEAGEQGSVGIDNQAASNLEKKITENYPVEYDVLGTYHSHPPGYGIGQSSGDIKTMLSDPDYYKNQIFVVIDPEKAEQSLAEGVAIYGYPKEGKSNPFPTFGVIK